MSSWPGNGSAAPPASAAPYEYAAEEDEEDLFDEDVDLGIRGNNAPAGQYFEGEGAVEYTEQQRRAEEAIAQAQAQEALASVPEPVKKYIIHLHNILNAPNPNLGEIQAAYDQGWNRLSEKFFAKAEWPEAEIIAPLVQHDEIFLTLYRELYYRHVLARLQPDIDDRFHSYENYCSLFNLILNSPGPVPLNLPIDWLYNIIDEFVYQYTSFCLWRSKVGPKTEDEKALLAESAQVWSCYSVLNVLYSLIQKSKIQEQLAAAKAGEDPESVAGDYGSIPLYYHLGYFSILGLLRVHVLLGDYSLALSMLDSIELNKKALFTRVTSAHVATYYYVGFSYMMMGRYPDAIRAFAHILFFVLRLKHFQRGSQFDQINKTADRMYSLLAICHALCPTKLDEGISAALREKYGEQHARMLRGGDESLSAYEELFLHGSPKFISPNPPPYDNPSALEEHGKLVDPSVHQVNIFLLQVKTQVSIPSLKSLLRLYTSIGTDKLATFLGVPEEEVAEMLMTAKGASRKLTWVQGSLLEGEYVGVSDLNFALDDSLVNVAESKTSRRYADFFLRHAIKFNDLATNIAARPLPTPPKAAAGPQVAGATPAAEGAPKAAPTAAKPSVSWASQAKA